VKCEAYFHWACFLNFRFEFNAGLEAVGRGRRRLSGLGHAGRIAGVDPAENPASGVLAFALIYPCERISA